jgi:TPP-dependent pyruvate/acetoin dehydrogenase alpha subunit
MGLRRRHGDQQAVAGIDLKVLSGVHHVLEDLGSRDLVQIYRWLVPSRKFDEAWVKLFYEQKSPENPWTKSGTKRMQRQYAQYVTRALRNGL